MKAVILVENGRVTRCHLRVKSADADALAVKWCLEKFSHRALDEKYFREVFETLDDYSRLDVTVTIVNAQEQDSDEEN